MIEIEIQILLAGVVAIVSASVLLTRRSVRGFPWMPLAAVVLLVSAAVGIRMPDVGSGRPLRIVDVSWSMGEPVDLPARDGSHVLAFGRRTVDVPDGSGAEAAIREAAGVDGSDLAKALRRAVEHVEPGSTATVLTDGRVSGEGLAGAAAAVRAAGAAIRVERAGRPRAGDVRVTSLRVPGRVPEGGDLTVLATVQGTSGSRVRVRLLFDGEETQSREVTLGVSGSAGLRFELSSLAAGRHEVGVAAVPRTGDPCPVNDRLAAGVVVVGARRAALLNAPGLGPALRAAGWTVTEGLSEDLSVFDLVVVRDAPILTFPDRGEALRRYVESGGGLLVAGGTRCFGPGGWGGSPLEASLPVRSHPAEEGLFVAVLLDRSGTMGDPFRVDGPAKFEAARIATEALVDLLPDGAQIVVLPFADEVIGEARVLTMKDEASRAGVRETLRAVGRPKGGTSLVRPLARVTELLGAVEAEKRLVLLFSDGRLEGERPEAVVAAAAALRGAGARIACLAVGEDADRELLDGLSGPGRAAVPVTESGQVRTGFLDALFELQGEDRILAGEQTVRTTGEPGLPVIPVSSARGVVRTWLRPGAVAWHRADDDVPVTAGGRYGLGRAIVSTADLSGLPEALASALVQAAARPSGLASVRIDVRHERGRASVTASVAVETPELTGFVTDAAGARTAIVLSATAPGTFSGEFSRPTAGAVWFDLAAGSGTTLRAGASVPWAPEYRASGPDDDALAALRERLGRDAFDERSGSRDVSWLPALAALLLFLADRLRLALKRRGSPVR